MNKLGNPAVRTRLLAVSALLALTAALPASAQSGGSTTRGTTGGNVYSPSTGSGVPQRPPVIRDNSPPIQAPSVDTNPGGMYRGQSMYPPRATTQDR